MVRAGAITRGRGACRHSERPAPRCTVTVYGSRAAGVSAHGSPRTGTGRPASPHTVHRVRGAAQYTVTPYADSASVTGWWMAEPEVPEQPELPEWMPRATEPAKCAPPLSPPAEQAVVRTML